jgi:hypothetical protein
VSPALPRRIAPLTLATAAATATAAIAIAIAIAIATLRSGEALAVAIAYSFTTIVDDFNAQEERRSVFSGEGETLFFANIPYPAKQTNKQTNEER